MIIQFIATDPTGRVHRNANQEAFEALLRDLRAQFPDDYILVRADVRNDAHLDNDTQMPTPDRGAA